MPSSITTRHNGVRCSFTEADHKYWHGDDDDETSKFQNALISVSTLVHQFSQPFDELACAEKVAARDGRDPDSVIQEWAARRDEACFFGTRVHETAEDCIAGRRPRNTPRDDREKAFFRGIWNYASGLKQKFTSVETEKMVFSPRLGVAGTIDLLLDFNGRKFIGDWKTNADIRKPAYKNMLAPFDHIPDDALHHYYLQLSMYRIILETDGYCGHDIGGGNLFWIHESNVGTEVERIECEDMRAEAALMIALRYETPWFKERMKRVF